MDKSSQPFQEDPMGNSDREATTAPAPPLLTNLNQRPLNLFLIDSDPLTLMSIELVFSAHPTPQIFRLVGTAPHIPAQRVMERVDLLIFCPEQLQDPDRSRYLSVELSKLPNTFEHCKFAVLHSAQFLDSRFRNRVEHLLKIIGMNPGIMVQRGEYHQLVHLAGLIAKGLGLR